MNVDRKCPSCGSTHLEPGKLQSTGKVYFRPENAKFFTLGTNNIEVAGNVCLECGHLMLVADPGKASKALGKRKAH